MKTPEEIKKSLKICMINEASCEGCAYSGYGCCTKLTSDAIAYINQLESRPTIEAEPVRHGRWIDSAPINIWRNYECSECKFEVSGGAPNYCPNCGAKMDAKDGEPK